MEQGNIFAEIMKRKVSAFDPRRTLRRSSTMCPQMVFKFLDIKNCAIQAKRQMERGGYDQQINRKNWNIWPAIGLLMGVVFIVSYIFGLHPNADSFLTRLLYLVGGVAFIGYGIKVIRTW